MDYPGEKLVIKLWETIAEKGIGSLLTPWQLAREGRARINLRRRELLMLTQAEVDAADIRAGRKYVTADGSLLALPAASAEPEDLADPETESQLQIGSLVERLIRVDAAKTIREEINSTKAVLHAEDVLASDTQTPPDREVDEDWLYRWREHAGRVSTDELQQLWGKILAGEVKSPGSYSLRTLEFLKELSKEEAERITKLAQFVLEGCIVRSANEYLNEHGVSFDLLLEMQNLGVVSGVGGFLKRQWGSNSPDRFVRVLRSNGKALLVDDEQPDKTIALDAYPLTTIGIQLLGLGSFAPDVDYLRLIGTQIKNQGFTVALAEWQQTTESEGRFSNPQRIDNEKDSMVTSNITPAAIP